MQVPKADIGATYIFYYDETNNIRKFYIKEDGFDQTFTSNFIGGGLTFKGQAPHVEALISSFRLQQNTSEVKFKNIAHGDFITCLTSEKLKTYLQFINHSSLYAHFTSLNILYYALADMSILLLFIQKLQQIRDLTIPFI